MQLIRYLNLTSYKTNSIAKKIVKSNFFQMQEFNIDWNRILKNDPLKCAQSLICQILAGAEEDNKDVIPIIHFLKYVLSSFIRHFKKYAMLIINHDIFFKNYRYAIDIGAPEEIEIAYQRGQNATGFSEKCYKSYPYCPYAARTMLKILHIYSYIFGD